MVNKKIKRILLVEPPVTRPADFGSKKVRIGIVPPLGLTYLSAVLLKNNLEVKILDTLVEGQQNGGIYEKEFLRYGLSDEQIKQRIIEYAPDLVGISCLMSARAKDMANVCRLVKEVNKNIITVTGGAHPTTSYTEAMKDENLDFIILGEGDFSFLNLIETINESGDLAKVDGLAYKNSGQIMLNQKTRYIDNLDILPMPARNLLKMDNYIRTSSPHSGIKRQPFTSMITSRGCPFQCTFCVIRNLWGRKARFRSAQNVLAEIEHLINTYGIKEIHFEDDNITADRERAKAIFSGIIEKGWDLTLNSPSGLSVHTLDEELLALMKKAGYFSISIAIESGDPDVLKLMRKPVDLNKVRRIIIAARKVGLKTKGFFILGYPGETKEQMQRTVDYASQAGLDWALFFIATAIPGSELDELCREKGYLIDQHLDYVKQFYVPNIITPEFDPGYVEGIKSKANFEINFKNNINLRLGDYDRAIEDIGEVVKFYPHLDFAHFYLGVAYEKKGLKQQALLEFGKTLEINPEHKEAKIKINENILHN